MPKRSQRTQDEIRRLQNRIELLEIDRDYYRKACERTFPLMDRLWDIFESAEQAQQVAMELHKRLSSYSIIEDAEYYLWNERRQRAKRKQRRVKVKEL
jgi:hypothetical protein